MAKQQVDFTAHYEHVMKALQTHGLLLGSYDAAGKADLMTISWGTIGTIWSAPIWTVLVRPSRYSYNNIEHSGCFTVNVPTEAMGMACAICGSTSGPDIDQFDKTGLTAEKGTQVLAPRVVECPIVYECQVVHSNDIIPEKLSGEILTGAYVDGDYHRIYFGKILAVHAEPNAAELLNE